MTSASLPDTPLAEWDAAHSRLLSVDGVGADAGHERTWHYADTGDALERMDVTPVGTVLAVHGNPTWSYLWRSVIARSLEIARAGGPAWRIVAVDQLEMGWSERSGLRRDLAQRIADLGAFTDALDLSSPVVTLGHDWGGVISLGWATEHPELLAGVMLLNTAVHQDAAVPIPAPLRLARARGMIAAGSVHTTAFLDVTLSLASPALDPAVRAAYRSPYRTAARRDGIGGFVADIPVGPSHESHARLEQLASDVSRLRVPALMLWGPEDPIFSDRYLADLIERMPRADVHRFEGAGHLVIDDAPVADALMSWLQEDHSPSRQPASAGVSDDAFEPLGHRLEQRRSDRSDAIVESVGNRGSGIRRVSWRQLNDRVERLAAGLHTMGVRTGDRVALLVTPGATLTAVVYACLRLGAVAVVADAGLGVRGLGRAITSARPDYIIGERRGLAAARVLGWPGVRISAARLAPAIAATLGVSTSLPELLARRSQVSLPPVPGPDDLAAILFTSGSTGPAKGVVYSHGQLSALRDSLETALSLSPDDGLVTGFAPFALLGPALGARSSTPEMDVSSPRTLTARAVAAAVASADGSVVFLSPAAILNVMATAGSLSSLELESLRRVRTVLSTGAPIGASLLTSLRSILPNASAHAVYGMTESLLVSDITLDEMITVAEDLGSASRDVRDDGVCVGLPIAGVEVLISPLDAEGHSGSMPTTATGVLGEIVISAPHLKSHYDRLWLTDREAIRDVPTEGRWHRTGDVGHLDAVGRLWIEGRLAHVIVTATGPVAPVGIEQAVETVPAVRRAAIVGVGPHGLRQFVAVVEAEPRARSAELAPAALAAQIRATTSHPIVAVLSVNSLPTDIRHNSKIDRARLSTWAETILAGHRPTAP